VQCGWSAEIVKVIDRRSSRVNVVAKHPDTGEAKLFPNVPYMPREKREPNSWHYVEHVD
jgi:hypothetical protein